MGDFDLQRLQQLAVEADTLIERGLWTRAEFERLWKATEEASGGQDDVFESLIRKADPSWL